MKVLLVSNSTLHQRGYLDHVASFIQELFRGATRIAFIPHALFDREAYARRAEQRFAELGLELVSVHRADDPQAAVGAADGIFVGGGNTFRLLDSLYRHGLLDAIRKRVDAGVPFLGSSAGSIVAGPTIMTTKDMPVGATAHLPVASSGELPDQPSLPRSRSPHDAHGRDPGGADPPVSGRE